MISVTLSNQDCIFDSAEFDSAEEAFDWMMGRGGKYTAYISDDGEIESPQDCVIYRISGHTITGEDYNLVSYDRALKTLAKFNR